MRLVSAAVVAFSLAFVSFFPTHAASAPVFKVTDYTGVVANDANADHSGINAAIDDAIAAGGGVVYFPPGEYRIGGSLVIDAPHVTLRGEGATLRATSGSVDVVVVTQTSDAVIENLRIIGTGTTDMSGYPGDGTAIDVRQSSFVRVRNNDIHFMTGTGIIVTGKLDSTYSATATHDVWVQNNFIEYCNQGITVFSGAKHVFVSENKIEYARTWSIGVDDRSVNDTVANACENVEITNNILRYSGMTSGSSQTAIALIAARYCSVIGNQIMEAGRGVSPAALVTAIGVTSGQSDNIAANNLVAGNLIVRPVRGGIYLAAADYNSIQGNTLVDVGTDAPSGATSAVKLAKAQIDGTTDRGAKYNRISENVVIRNGSADTDYGVRIDDSLCDSNIIMNETYRGVTSAAVSDAGTNTISWHVTNDGVDVAANRDIATSATLNFTLALAAQSCETLTVTVTGAADGDLVVLGLPNAIANAAANQTFDAWAAAANSVRVRRCNAGSTTLAAVSGTAKIAILKR